MPSPLERVVVASPVGIGGGRVIASPFQFLVDGNDHLRVEGWNVSSGAALQVSYRFYGLDGKVRAERHTVPLSADRAVTERDVALGPGFLVNMVVVVTGAEPLVGQTFTCIKLIRGLSGATIVLGLLLQGYVTHEQGLGWPGSPIEASVSDVNGYIRQITGTNPAAGADISETVPTGARWELLSCFAEFDTAVGGGDRSPLLVWLVNGTTAGLTFSTTAQLANSNGQYAWAQNVPNAIDAANRRRTVPFGSRVILPGGASFQTSTVNLAAGDNWSAPACLVREWLTAA